MNILINNSSSSDEFELKPINNPNHPCFFQEKMVLKFKPHRYTNASI